MTRLVIITLAALTISGVAASAQSRDNGTKAYTERAPGYSQAFDYNAPIILGVAY